MRIGRFEIVVRRIKKFPKATDFTQKSLIQFLRKNVDVNKLNRLIIDADKDEIEIVEYL